MGKSADPIVIGYHYYFGIHMGIARGPLDELVEIRVGDRKVWAHDPNAPGQVFLPVFRFGGLWGVMEQLPAKLTWPFRITSSRIIEIRAHDVFGGEKKEGGILGSMAVMMGEPDQPVNPRLAAMQGGDIPAHRGVCTLFFDGLISSMSPYPKPWTFRTRRALKGWDGEPWYPEKAVILLAADRIHAMNPAHVLYECLTNRDWGRGLDRERLDDASYRAAADTLYSENFGFCRRWSRQNAIGDFMQSVLDHIGATQFVDRTTGLITLRLIRDDYVAEELPLFTYGTGLLAVDDDDNGAAAEATNEIVVKYLDPISNEVGTVRVKNLASIQQVGTASETHEYPGLPHASLAGRVALRDLRAQSGLAKRFKVRLDRRGRRIEPGGPFRISVPDRGIENMVVRAGRIEEEGEGKGTITVTAVQDIFGLPSTSYVQVQESLWEPPDFSALPIQDARLLEVSYRDAIMALDAANQELLEDTSCALAIVAARPTGLSQSYDIQTRVGSAEWADRGTGEFCPHSELTEAVGAGDGAISVIGNAYLALVRVGSAALLGHEIVRVDSIDDTTGVIQIGRGCVDTVPTAWVAGTSIWFYEGAIARDPTEYAPGTTVEARLLTRTGSERLDPALATILSETTQQRLGRPYPPGRLRINGLAYPEVGAGELAVTWSHRDRTLQADQLVDSDEADIGPEPGVAYNVRLRNAESGAILQEILATTATSATLSADFGGSVIVDVEAVRDGLVAWQILTHTMRYSGTELLPALNGWDLSITDLTPDFNLQDIVNG